jgi:prepilin-type N-terminal cleavage/methylation domain-containing protein
MLNKIKKSNSEGFTIIEVMIVLAVAALILLIVLLAVPALQRNARNTALKNDASTVSGGITTYESDNSGSTPNIVTNCDSGNINSINPGTVTLSSPSGSNETVQVQNSTCVFTVQEQTPTTLATTDFTTASTPTISSSGIGSGFTLNTGQIMVVTNASCWNSGTQASTRTLAVVFYEETSGNPIPQCLQS